jgi:hypothetical protein
MWFVDVVVDLPWFVEKKGKLGNLGHAPASRSLVRTLALAGVLGVRVRLTLW